MSRVVAVARLQALGRRDALLWPPLIGGLVFVANLLVFASIASELPDKPITGGLFSVYATALAYGAVAISQQFPFALGMSVTRREFALALGVFLLVQAVVYAVLLTAAQLVEDATGGWGIGLRFFGFGALDSVPVAAQFAAYAVPLLLMSLLGAAMGVVHLRWRTSGLFTVFGAMILVGGGAAALVPRFGGWAELWSWLSAQSVPMLLAVWPLPVVLLLALTAWSTLRRATP